MALAFVCKIGLPCVVDREPQPEATVGVVGLLVSVFGFGFMVFWLVICWGLSLGG